VVFPIMEEWTRLCTLMVDGVLTYEEPKLVEPLEITSQALNSPSKSHF
jgi:hypothetical protein